MRGQVGPCARLARVPLRRRVEEQGLTEPTEAAFIVRALDAAFFGVGVEALVAGGAVAVLGVPPALGHAPEIVLVEELTRIALLAEPSEPVLADGGESLAFARMGRKLLWRLEVCGRRRSVPQRAVEGPEGAAGGGEGETAYLVVWRGWD